SRSDHGGGGKDRSDSVSDPPLPAVPVRRRRPLAAPAGAGARLALRPHAVPLLRSGAVLSRAAAGGKLGSGLPGRALSRAPAAAGSLAAGAGPALAVGTVRDRWRRPSGGRLSEQRQPQETRSLSGAARLLRFPAL